MKFASKLLIMTGILMVIYAFNMDITLHGADVVNMHLLSNRQNYTILGSILFLSGVILFASTKMHKSAADDKIDISTDKIKTQAISYINKVYTKLNISSQWLFIVSTIFVIISFITSWSYHGSKYFTDSWYIDHLLFMLFYVHPIVNITKSTVMSRKFLIPCSMALLFISYTGLDSASYTNHIGPKMEMAAAILYLIGAVKISNRNNLITSNIHTTNI